MHFKRTRVFIMQIGFDSKKKVIRRRIKDKERVTTTLSRT
jgi:hypothetical protein